MQHVGPEIKRRRTELAVRAQRLCVSHLHVQPGDFWALLEVQLRQAAPDALRIVEIVRAIAIEAEQRPRVEDAHALPQCQALRGRYYRLFTNLDDVNSPIELPAKKLERETVAECEAARRVRRRAYWAGQPDEKALGECARLPDRDEQQEGDKPGEIAFPRERRDRAGDAKQPQPRAERPGAVDDALAIPVEQVVVMVHRCRQKRQRKLGVRETPA